LCKWDNLNYHSSKTKCEAVESLEMDEAIYSLSYLDSPGNLFEENQLNPTYMQFDLNFLHLLNIDFENSNHYRFHKKYFPSTHSYINFISSEIQN
jgi:hypothetical protein